MKYIVFFKKYLKFILFLYQFMLKKYFFSAPSSQ
jgi:hypothetical protein